MNTLPLEIQAEILKSLPFQQRINKNLNRYNKELYYHEFCNLPISEYELLKYITTRPEKLVIFNEDIDETFTIGTFQLIDDEYKIATHVLSIEMDEMNEYHVNHDYHQIGELRDISSYISNLYDNEEFNPYFDLFTTYNIVNDRHCEQLKSGYAKRYTLNEYDNHIKEIEVNNLYSFFEAYQFLIYIDVNINVYIGDDLDNFDYPLDEILFDHMGDFYDDDDINIIENLIQKYQKHVHQLHELVK